MTKFQSQTYLINIVIQHEEDLDCDQGQRDAVLKQIQLLENPRRSGSAWEWQLKWKQFGLGE